MRWRYTLVADGTSDVVLTRVIDWALEKNCEELFEAQVASNSVLKDHGRVRRLDSRLNTAVRLYPCNLLFVHRDAESGTLDERIDEIVNASRGLAHFDGQIVPVVPIRMTEAWLLFDQAAIRYAAGNPNGRAKLDLPTTSSAERITNPKAVLYQALADATELSTRRRRSKRPDAMVHHVADHITDFAPLRDLSAFQEFETRLRSALGNLRL